MINICILGYGAVGQEVYNMLRFRKDVSVKKIFVKTIRDISSIPFVYKELDIFDNIDLVIDALPNIEPSKRIILNCLSKGIPVITCNKELIWTNKEILFNCSLNTKNGLYLSSIMSNSNRFYFELNSNNFDELKQIDPFSYRGGNAKITAWDIVKDIDQYKKDNGINIKPSLEITPILKNNISYSSITQEVLDGLNVYKYKDVIIKNNDTSNIIYLKGTNTLLTGVRHYFHYLKEYLGPYLFYKNKCKETLNVIWINDAWGGERYHDVSEVVSFTKSIVNPKIEINYDDFIKNNYKIDELVVIFDGGYLVVDPYRHMIDHIYPKTDSALIELMSEYMVGDESMPDKIYISRRLVSQYLEEEGRTDHISRHNPAWLEDAIEDYFKSNGYTIIELSGMKFQDQVKHFYNAKKIAGQDGAGFINGIFCKNGAEFFLIKLHDWHSYSYENDILNIIQCKFNYLSMEKTESYEDATNQLLKILPYPILL